MFKIKIPTSSSLVLLAIVSVLLIGGLVESQTSDAQSALSTDSTSAQSPNLDDSPNIQQQHDDNSQVTINGSAPTTDRNAPADARKRGGRLYNQAGGFGGQQQASMDSYAAAYAAANSASPPDHAQDLVQTSVQAANDAASYASFGELAPPGSSGAAAGTSSSSSLLANSAARQLPSQSDYSPHASYYSSYMAPSSQSSSYSGNAGQPSSASYHSASQAYHAYPAHYSSGKESRPMGYPTNVGYDHHAASSGYYERTSPHYGSMPLWASGPALSSSSGLMSSASTALSSWTSGFSVAEIICGLIAISIGAIILGAPFFLIYLALMGNFSGSGTLSLTNPTGGASPAGAATTTVNGRRKRLAIFEQLTSSVNHKSAAELGSFAESIANQLSPYVDLQQVASTFKRLVKSIDKYSHMGPEGTKKKSN